MFQRFAQRSHRLERLDTGDYTPAEYARWLDEAKFINRRLGDADALRLTLAEQDWATTAEPISILDVGAGSGEMLKAAGELLKPKTTLLVGAELSFPAAAAIAERRREFPVMPIQCDGLRLPFDARVFDVVLSSLMLHHLTDEQASAVLREMGRVSKRLVVVIDLYRGPVSYYLYRIFAPLFLQSLTVEDGELSILRGFKPDEMVALAANAGLSDVRVRRAAYRLILSAAQQ